MTKQRLTLWIAWRRTYAFLVPFVLAFAFMVGLWALGTPPWVRGLSVIPLLYLAGYWAARWQRTQKESEQAARHVEDKLYERPVESTLDRQRFLAWRRNGRK